MSKTMLRKLIADAQIDAAMQIVVIGKGVLDDPSIPAEAAAEAQLGVQTGDDLVCKHTETVLPDTLWGWGIMRKAAVHVAYARLLARGCEPEQARARSARIALRWEQKTRLCVGAQYRALLCPPLAEPAALAS